ncbi:MAG: recombinase family protein [Parabacteroides sp.]|nr:recombinase family protein [Parabacteroides sp.]
MKAIIYARVSSVTDRQSTDRQVIDLTKCISDRGYKLVGVFSEKISGATKNADRAVLNDAIKFVQENNVEMIFFSELSRLGRNVFEIQETVKRLIDLKIDAFFQKESFQLLDADKKPNPYASIMIAVLGTCAEIERENIKFRLNSGRNQYIANGGKLGRKEGSKKTKEQKADEYKKVLSDLRAGKSIRDVAKLNEVSPSTVQSLKKEFGIS